MGRVVSQITSLTIVYSTVYSGANQRKYQSSASLAFVRGIHRGPKMFPFDDVTMKKRRDDTRQSVALRQPSKTRKVFPGFEKYCVFDSIKDYNGYI